MLGEPVFTIKIPTVAPKRPCPAPAAPAEWRCLGAARPGSATKASAPAAAAAMHEAEKRPAARPAAQASAPATTPQKAEKKSPVTEQAPAGGSCQVAAEAAQAPGIEG